MHVRRSSRSLMLIQDAPSRHILNASHPYENREFQLSLINLLFVGKNYPNVSINFCPAHQVDPIYSAKKMAQSVATVPYTKIHGIGT